MTNDDDRGSNPSTGSVANAGTLRDAIVAGLAADHTREREDRLFWAVSEFVDRVIAKRRLTDAEREAIKVAIGRELDAEWYGGPEPENVTTLRALLKRLK